MNKFLISNVIIVSVLILFGKTISFIKNIFISYYFGSTIEADTYFIANTIPSVIFWAFISACTVLLLPEYCRQKKFGGEVYANKFLSNYLNIIVLISIFLTFVSYIYAGEFIYVIAPNLTADGYNLAKKLCQILVISYPFTAICMSISTISTSYNKFYAPHMIPIFSGVVTIVGLILFVESYGIVIVAITGVVAVVLQSIIQVIIARSYFRPSFSIPKFDEKIKNISILAAPVFITTTIEQLNLISNNILGTGLGIGAISSLNYAQTIQLTIYAVVCSSVLTVIYPVMSGLSGSSKYFELIELTVKWIKISILLLTPILTFIGVNVKQFIEIVFYRGSFDNNALIATSESMFAYLPGVIFLTIREFLVRIYYLNDRTFHIMVVIVSSVLINVLLSFLLVPYLGISGLALGNSLSILFSIFFIFIWLGNLNISYASLINGCMFLLKLMIGMLLILIVNYHFYVFLKQSIFNFIMSFLLSFILFMILMYIMKIREIIDIFFMIKILSVKIKVGKIK